MTASVTVTNTGSRAGTDVVQVYAHAADDARRRDRADPRAWSASRA